MSQKPLTGLSFDELKSDFYRMGEKPYRTKQVVEWLYWSGAKSFSDMTNLSEAFRGKLGQAFSISLPKVEAFTSTDGTVKYRFTLEDGEAIEAVWIPEKKRNTLCISSQVGCALKCAFCVTGVVGFKRNISISEIVDQVRYIKVIEKRPVSNVVFMGMGEPLLNMENVIGAIEILTHPHMMAIGKRKISVSTAGIVPNIRKFFETTDVKLAISLTGTTDESRDYWMPINRKYNLDQLTNELRNMKLANGRHLMFEVVLMKSQNDSPEEAERLGKLLKGIPAKVNLIPYNENPFFPKLKRPDKPAIEKFRTVLARYGIFSMVRNNRGEDILAACGQLAGNNQPKEIGV